MKVALDTAVLVAAARSRNGASFQIISMLPDAKFEFALTVPLYSEWQAALTRKENLPPGTTIEDAMDFLRYLVSIANLHDVHFLWRPFLRDPNDDMVLECAIAGNCEYIVTHNVKDFQRVSELNIKVVTPSQFLKLIRSKK